MSTENKATELQVAKKKNTLIEIEQAKSHFDVQLGKDAEAIYDREKAYAIMAIQKNPSIMDCRKNSIMLAVAAVAMTGLTLNPVLGYCHLIPRGGICTLSIDFKGLIFILMRDGNVKHVNADAIYDCDKVEGYQVGINGYVKVQPDILNRPKDAKIIGAYCEVIFNDGTTHVHMLNADEIERRRKVASTDAVWKAWPKEMAIKSVIRSHYKYLPKSDQATKAMELIDKEQDAQFVNKTNPLPDGLLDEDAEHTDVTDQKELSPANDLPPTV